MNDEDERPSGNASVPSEHERRLRRAGWLTSKPALIVLSMLVVAISAVGIALLVTQLNHDDDSTASSSSAKTTESLQASPAPSVAPVTDETGSSAPTNPPTELPTTQDDPDDVLLPTTSPDTNPPTELPTQEPPPTASPDDTSSSGGGDIRLGSADGVAYYHCAAADSLPPDQQHHIVLLHGAAFTKEIWIDTGILEQFCAVPQVSATALDLSVSSGNAALRSVLDALVAVEDAPKPVVLVTPSASGYTVVDWLVNGDTSLIPSYLSAWIPVAVGTLPQATDEELVAGLGSLPVLAIYGDGDTTGGRLSLRLERVVGATVVELEGGHPVYRDSPDDFVQEILLFLDVLP